MISSADSISLAEPPWHCKSGIEFQFIEPIKTFGSIRIAELKDIAAMKINYFESRCKK
jgi:hypothetical protein